MKKDKIVALITAVSISSTLVLTDKEVYAKGLENNKNKNNLVHNSENEYLDEDNIDLNAIKDDEENPIIEIPDPNLKAVLNEIIDKNRPSDKDIRKSELALITKVAANRKNIKNLEGLQYCVNATAIALPNNEIEDLSPISNLTKVVDLELEGNQISNLEPLKNLTNLIFLKLSNNKISDLNPISNLENLHELYISLNKISDITPLKGLKNLTFLNLSDNKIKDIKTLSNLTKLNYLNLDRNLLDDLKDLVTLKEMEILSLDDNNITNIEPIGELKKITTLFLDRNNITDISPLSNLNLLESLTISENEVEDLSPISKAYNLISLTAAFNKIKDITPLSNLKELSYLKLNNNMIGNIDIVTNFKKLEYFYAQDQKVYLPEITVRKNFAKITNPIISLFNESIKPYNISSEGVYNKEDNSIVWNNISSDRSEKFKFYKDLRKRKEYQEEEPWIFSGEVFQDIKYKSNEIPVIEGVENVTIKQDTEFNPMKGVSASDFEDGNITKDIKIEGTVNTKVPGKYELTYTVTDSDNNTVSKKRIVTVLPKLTNLNHVPVIEAKDRVLTVGDTFNPLDGVSAYDNEDKKIELTKENIVSNDVNTEKAGTYEVTYKVTDSQGATVTKTIKVTVNPRQEVINHVPVIKAEDKVLTVGDKFNPLEGVSAYDDEDKDIKLTEANVIFNNVNTKKAGTYEVTYKVTDSQGATVTKTIKVTVNPRQEVINHVPVIKAEDKVLTVGDKFNPLEGVSAYDDEDKDIKLTEANVIFNNVNTKVAGTYEVTYKVTDSEGATVTKTIKVTVNPKQNNEDNSNNSIDKLPNTGAVNTLPLFSLASILGGISLLFKRKNKPKK